MAEAEEDSQLVELAQAGDKEAFGRLVERYEGLAGRIALRLVAQPETARELVQEALLEAYLSLPHLREPARFKSWFYGLVLNICRNYRRRPKLQLFSLETLAGGLAFETFPFEAAAPDLQQIAEARELHQAVLQAVGFLSPKNRAATLLFYYEGLRLDEIAAVLGISVTAVKGRLHKARNELRTYLLPLYAEASPDSADRRKKAMVKVTVLDVVPQVVEDKKHLAVVLHDAAGRRLLPIWVGAYEGESIGLAVNGLAAPRPLTFDFLANILKASGVKLEEVRIEKLKDDTFFAVARLSQGQTFHEVDARPSDAMALALRLDTPILVAEEVFEAVGVPVPDQSHSTGAGLTTLATEFEAAQQQWKTLTSTAAHHERAAKSREELLNYLFGA